MYISLALLGVQGKDLKMSTASLEVSLVLHQESLMVLYQESSMVLHQVSSASPEVWMVWLESWSEELGESLESQDHWFWAWSCRGSPAQIRG